MSLLTESQISDELATVPAWTRDGNSITTVTERSDFRDALLYVGAVAYLAETANHHPDVTIAWNKVTLTLSTHSAGGLTASDFNLARQISGPLASARCSTKFAQNDTFNPLMSPPKACHRGQARCRLGDTAR